MKKPIYSIVVPFYACKNVAKELNKRIDSVFKGLKLDYELILVDDKSDDETWEVLQEVCAENSKVKAIELSRNFGQHYAITCGLSYSTGEWVIVMDCDLQDVPEEIPKLIQKAKEGFQIVFASRHERKDSFFKRLGSKMFYRTLGYLTDTKQDHTIANFGLYHYKAIEAVLSMKDQIRYFPTMIQWVGFNKTSIQVNHSEREEGKSSYSLKKLIALAFNNIIAFSDKPLRITIKCGVTISFLSFIMGIYYLILYIKGDIFQLGFTSLILSIWFLSGIIILTLGVLGIYLGKVFDKVKERPSFLVNRTENI
ncbi:MAG: glycosyltransferase family 2 protein [Flavobacteriales bacterium]|nr:glycosyltransferase family 2 protein [Flavobacteriales bacterium]